MASFYGEPIIKEPDLLYFKFNDEDVMPFSYRRVINLHSDLLEEIFLGGLVAGVGTEHIPIDLPMQSKYFYLLLLFCNNENDDLIKMFIQRANPFLLLSDVCEHLRLQPLPHVQTLSKFLGVMLIDAMQLFSLEDSNGQHPAPGWHVNEVCLKCTDHAERDFITMPLNELTLWSSPKVDRKVGMGEGFHGSYVLEVPFTKFILELLRKYFRYLSDESTRISMIRSILHGRTFQSLDLPLRRACDFLGISAAMIIVCINQALEVSSDDDDVANKATSSFNP